MNRISITKIVFAFAAVLLLSTSCKNEIDDTFSESSALRIQHALQQYNQILYEAPNGWVMDYFPNDTLPGYTYLVKFDKNGSSKFAGKNKYLNNTYKEETSVYDLISDNGPVLSFSTYNTIFHLFSNPADPNGTNGKMQGIGLGGDYEFIFMKVSDDLIELQGKKRGTTILLKRLQEGQDWEGYFKKLENIKESLFSPKIKALLFNAPNGEKYTIYDPLSGFLKAVPEGGDTISQMTKVPYIMQEDGIRLLNPFKGDNKKFSVQSFSITEDGYLLSNENNASSIKAASPAKTFLDGSLWKNGNKWKLIPSGMGGKFKEQFTIISQKSIASFKREYDYSFMYSTKVAGLSLSFAYQKLEMGAKAITVELDESNPEQIKFSVLNKIEAGWNTLVSYVPEVENFVSLFAATTYTAHVIGYNIKPSTLKLISTTDKNDYFTISVE